MNESTPLFGDNERRQFRGAYRASRAWSNCAQAITLIGLVCAVARWGWRGPITGVLGLGVFVAAIAAAVCCGEGGLRKLPRMVWLGFATGFVVTGVAGLVAVFQVAGLIVVLLLVGTAPAFITGIRVLWHSVMDTPDTVRPDGPVSPQPHATRDDIDLPDRLAWLAEDIGSLDDVSLCLAWRRSFVLLEAAQTPEERMAVVEQREQCLDELQRRCPEGVAAWLSSGARASGNPLPFLSADPPPPPA